MGGKKGFCGLTCLKNTLDIFNLVFVLAGIGIIGVVVWTLFDRYEYVQLLSAPTYPILVNFLLACGILILGVSFLGCFATYKENGLLLILYIVVLLLIFLMEVMVGILGYIYEENIRAELGLNLNQTFLTSYGIDERKTLAIDALQQKFQCCGAEKFEDWQFSYWVLDGLSEINIVPDSCCQTRSPFCGRRNHPSNIYYDGCMDKMANHLIKHTLILSAVGLGFCVLQIIGIILALKVYFKMKKEVASTAETKAFLRESGTYEKY